MSYFILNVTDKENLHYRLQRASWLQRESMATFASTGLLALVDSIEKNCEQELLDNYDRAMKKKTEKTEKTE